jgi:hypothetical protein
MRRGIEVGPRFRRTLTALDAIEKLSSLMGSSGNCKTSFQLLSVADRQQI